MPRVLFLTWSRNQPSTKYRVHQYLDGLQRDGFETEVFLANGLTPARRFKMLQKAKAADIVFIQKKLFHPVFLHLLKAANSNIVFDFDDAAFASEPYNPKPRGMSPGSRSSVARLKAVLKAANTVLAGNSFLASYAARYNHNVHALPTPVDTAGRRPSHHPQPRAGAREGAVDGREAVPPPSGHADSGERQPAEAASGGHGLPQRTALDIGWLGTSKNLYYLEGLTGALKEVIHACPWVKLSVLSNGRFNSEHFPVENLPWSPETESEWLGKVDIGIMPLEHDDWSRGKCAFKLLQYMAAGLPTVSSPVGMNSEVVQDGVNGLLADTQDEWVKKLLALVNDSKLRDDIGRSGRRTVEQEYSLAVCQKRLRDILQVALG